MNFERNFDLINIKFRELLIPSILLSISDNIAILFDAILISLILGSEYLPVIQLCSPLIFIVAIFYWMVGHGGSSLSSIAKSDFNNNESDMIFTVSIISVIALSLAITISFFLFPNMYINFLCADEALKPAVYQYLVYFVIAFPFISYTSCMAFFIKYYGFIQLQFRAFLMANIINIICDIIFMKYLNFGISGASLAMLVGFLCSSIYISSYFFNAKKSIKLIKFKTLTFFKYLKQICKFGFSVSSLNLYAAIRLLLLNYLLIILAGPIGLEAYNMCMNSLIVLVMFVLGTVEAIVPIVSAYYEEKDYNGVFYVSNKSLKLVIVISLFFTVLLVVYPDIILYLFNVDNKDKIPIVLDAIRLYSLSFLGYSINSLYLFYCQSVQNTKLANIIAILENLILPVLLAYLLSDFLGINGVWVSFILCEYLIIMMLYTYSKHVSRKTNNEYSGFFLNKHNDKKTILEYTINGNVDDVLSLSKIIQKSLSDPKLSIMVSSTIKDFLVKIIDINEDINLIDVFVMDEKETVSFSIKYNGTLYNPNEDEALDEESLLYKIRELYKSSEILELNNITININKNDF